MSEPNQRLPGRCVLLVEDEPGLQEALVLTLELEGLSVTCASDGREGLAAAARDRPDLILTDYMMPHMNGLQMIDRLRADAALAKIPILLMSAAIPQHLDTSKADAFLPKPMSITCLVTTIERLLGNA